MPYGSICCTYHQLKCSSPNCANKQNTTRATQKNLPFGKWRFVEEKVRRNGPKAEKDNTARATGLGKRTREERDIYIYKRGIKLTALKFQTGGRHQKSPGLPSGDKTERAIARTRQKNKRGDIEKKKKEVQNDSPEILDRGETSEIPRPPFWGIRQKEQQD